jgi:uncharacterized protein (DUF58 family)
MLFLPTPRLALLAFAGVAIALAGLAIPGATGPLLGLDAALVVAALVDAALLLGPALEVRREAGAILSVGRANAIHLHLRSHRRASVTVQVQDDPIDHADAHGIPTTLVLPPHRTATVTFELVPTRRGPRQFGEVTLRLRGALGLMIRQERSSPGGSFEVYPDVHAARSLELLRRRGRKEGATGSVRSSGGDTEIERLRPYVAGDEPRHFDWKATARKDEPIVRQLQAESEQNVLFAIDVGRAMRGESEGLSRVDRALNAAMLTADVCLRNGDRAGLLAFDDAPRAYLHPTPGRSAARKLARATYALEPGLAPTDFSAAMQMLRTKLPSRTLVILFTHLLDDAAADAMTRSVAALMPRHLPLCVLMRDPEVDAMIDERAMDRHDLYTRAAAAEELNARDALLRRLRDAGALVIEARPGDVTPELVRGYLEVKARRLL